MKIIERDCYIEYKNSVYTLYLMKNKKEKKEEVQEDATDTHKIGGYFIHLDSVFKAIIKFREHKKYSFKEEHVKLKVNIKAYIRYKKQFMKELTAIYKPITEFKNELFIYENKRSNYWK